MISSEEYFYGRATKEEQDILSYVPTFPEFLEKINNLYPDKECLGNTVVKYTYNEVYKRVARRRQYLYDIGLEAGDKVAVMARNCVDAMEWFLAIPSAGMILIMLPVQLNEMQLIGSAKKFGISAVFASEEFKGLMDKVPARICDIDAIADTEGEYGKNIVKETVAAIYFTGGTTGAPKGVVLNHGALLRGGHNGAFRVKNIFGNRYITLLPMSHIFGSVCGYLSGLYTGSYFFAIEDTKRAFGMIPTVRPTCLVAVPGMAEIILALAKMHGKEFLGDLNTMVLGAAPVPPRMMADFEKYGIKPCPGYGLTEGANLTCANFDAETKPDSMGIIYPGQQVKVVDNELWIKGDNVMDGYYNDPEATAKVLEDGWLKTGDLVSFDEEGFVTIVGRIKNLIILSNGENVSPEEVEEVFYKESFVKDCLVTEEEINGDAVIGIEILPYEPETEGMTPEDIQKKAEEVVKKVNETLPSFKRVSLVKVRDKDFARTGAMKIQRNIKQ